MIGRRTTVSYLGAALAVAGAIACGDGLDAGPTDVLRPAVIEFFDQPVLINLPGQAAAGQPVVLEVVSFGNGCVRLGETRVTERASGFLVEPFDFETVGIDVVCAEILNSITHAVSLTFPSAGTFTVEIRGGRQPEGDLVSFERTVDVQ